MAAFVLIPIYVGVGTLSFYEALPKEGSNKERTSILGIFFAISGVLVSSVYTVWIKAYHDGLEMNGMQLLFNYVSCSALHLLYILPFMDSFPVWTEVSMGKAAMIFIAGALDLCLLICCWGVSY